MKIFNIIVSMLMLISLSSCEKAIDLKDAEISLNNLDPRSAGTRTYKKLKKLTENRSLEVLECFDNHDKEGLKEMFAPAIAKDFSLDMQIDKAFEIYDSESVKYERLRTDEMGYGVNHGTYFLRRYDGDIYGIELKSGKILRLSIAICYVDDKNPDMIGINDIYLKDEKGVNLRIIGEYEDFQKELAE